MHACDRALVTAVWLCANATASRSEGSTQRRFSLLYTADSTDGSVVEASLLRQAVRALIALLPDAQQLLAGELVSEVTAAGSGWQIYSSVSRLGYVPSHILVDWFVQCSQTASLLALLKLEFGEVHHVSQRGNHHRFVLARSGGGGGGRAPTHLSPPSRADSA